MDKLDYVFLDSYSHFVAVIINHIKRNLWRPARIILCGSYPPVYFQSQRHAEFLLSHCTSREIITLAQWKILGSVNVLFMEVPILIHFKSLMNEFNG